MEILQLNTPIKVLIKDKEPAEAIAIWDYGRDEDIQFLCFKEKDGQSIFVNGTDIRRRK
jgi:hypothetical protein